MRRREDGGFTLIELMVVIVILGGLIAIVGPNVIGSIDRADVNRAKTQMANFQTAISQYVMLHRRLPTALGALTVPDPDTGESLIERIPNDPWGHPYHLRALGPRKYELSSDGRDGQEGTEDDLHWPAEAADESGGRPPSE